MLTESRMVLSSESGGFRSELVPLSSDLLSMDRFQSFRRARELVDVFSGIWLLGLADLPAGTIRLRSGEGWRALEGKVGVFLPPFSILEWKVLPGEFRWKAFGSVKPLPSAPTSVASFRWDGSLPRNEREISGFLDRHELVPVEGRRRSSALAERFKRHIDLHFKNESRIQKWAEELRVSRTVASREFKAAYGVSPISYRHRLRVFEAMRLIHSGYGVTESCFEVGFNDPGRFAGYFRHYLGLKPSKVSPSRAQSFFL